VFLLALDTCDSKGSVAVVRNDEALDTIAHESAEDYSTWLLPAVQMLLKATGVALADYDAYAVTAGPGSFTGVRMGLTTVKAWAEVYGRPIAAVSRLEAVATQALGEAPYVAAFADGRRGQVFAALYHRAGGELQQIEEEMVIAPDSFVAWAAETAGTNRIEWVSSEPRCILETRSWATRQAAGETMQTVSPILAPVVGRLGHRMALANRLTDALSLDANYVRRTDAESFRKGGSQLPPNAERRIPGPVVRKFLPPDADAIQEIAKRSPETAQWSCNSYAILSDPGYLAWVGEVRGAVSGFCIARIVGNEAEILNLAVHPAKRRAGIARALLNQALADFRVRSVDRVFLEVRESNMAAIHFYEKQRFTRTGLREGYYREPTEAAVLMMRKLID